MTGSRPASDIMHEHKPMLTHKHPWQSQLEPPETNVCDSTKNLHPLFIFANLFRNKINIFFLIFMEKHLAFFADIQQ